MSNGVLQELSARTPTLVPLNLHELDAIAAALAPQSRRRPSREMRRLISKIERVRTRKRKAARSKTKFW